jgi:uncharacterized repeat protein (TIGR03803 family)
MRSMYLVLACCLGLFACSHEAATPLLPAGSFISAVQAPDEGVDKAAFRSIYSFGKIAHDGSAPQSAPVAFNGLIFGTTTDGGADGFGTIFSITPQGVEKVRHNFKGTDGSQPGGNMIVHDSVLYGTTYVGGTIGFGTVFSLDRAGRLKVLHNFAGDSADGGFLQGGLVAFNSKFYGTTEGGGANGAGTLFSITSTGDEKLLHSFTTVEGAEPGSSLIVVNGALYGTTFADGKFGAGTAFRATVDGQVKVLHNFGSGTDGARPYNAFTNVNGTLYGTTGGGGTQGVGTVFKMTLAGKVTVLYSFDGAANGCTPFAGLTLMNGVLYGTTFGGSAGGCNSLGTIFRITPGGTETTLHDFGGGKGGGNPYGGLGVVGEKLYGTTQNDGYHRAGLVYSLTP